MPPSGEGVNLAMLDALELTEYLTGDGFTDIPTALAAYEKHMLARAAEEAQTSLDMLEWMHGAGAQAKMVEMISPGH
jgi:2-polyprenyl-6-methoxyphenol hydroxylase-like FAD-dependent oxidoreductase